MELRNFIQSTLVEIARGVKDANKIYLENGEELFRIIKGYEGELSQIRGQNPGLIYFDVAVSAGNAAGKSGKAGVFIKVVEMGGKIEDTKYSESISRIKFCVGINKEIK